jgi:Tol biopolymer transport system component
MKNVSRFVALFLTGSVLSFIVLLSCELQPSDISAETGSISLTFEFPNDEQLVAALARASDGRTIGGPIDEAIYNYRVTGSGPGGASFEKIVTTNGAVFPVTPGTWVITVTARALNDWVIIEDGLHDILEGTLTAEIRANETYYAVIPLLPIHGTGTLTVTLSWPSGLIADPIAEGTLVPHGTGAGGMTFPFSIDAGGATATLSQSLTTGYYRFTISLFDGTQLLWRKIEAVRILNEKTSLAEYTVTAPIPQTAIEFTVRYEYQNPVLITLSGVKDTVSEDETMTISAETVPAGTWYEWYLDGELIESGTADTVTIGNGLSAGYHWLDVLVEAGAVLGSKSAGFEVITNRPRGILYTNVSTYTVSPEGKIVVWELCTVDPDDPVPLQLTKWQYEDPNYFLDYFPGCAAWSPAGDRIAFTYMTGQNYLATSLFTMRPSGAGAKKLDTVWELTGASISSIAWSPDGKKIAYTENGDFQRLKVVTIDGSAPVTIKTDYILESSIREVSWSRDSERIVFSYRIIDWEYGGGVGRDSYEIFLINADGSGEIPVFESQGDDRTPAWSPVEDLIVFMSDMDGQWDIYSIRPDGTGLENLSSSTGDDMYPVWSPDGSRIAFQSNRDGNTEIYAMNKDGSGQLNLSGSPGVDERPGWSPDGTRIAFRSDRDGDSEIFVMNADGSDQRNLTNNTTYDSDPSW